MQQLSDEEIDKIAERVGQKLREDLYSNVGQGVLSLFWRGILIILIGLAAYGAGVVGLHLFK